MHILGGYCSSPMLTIVGAPPISPLEGKRSSASADGAQLAIVTDGDTRKSQMVANLSKSLKPRLF
jgi:hypothetical protein